MSGRSHRVTTFLLSVLAVSLVLAGILGAQVPPAPGQRAGGPPRQQKPTKKQLLVWCDTTGGGMYHDSVSHAMAVIEILAPPPRTVDPAPLEAPPGISACPRRRRPIGS